MLGAGYKSYANSGNESADSTGTLGECEEAVVGQMVGCSCFGRYGVVLVRQLLVLDVMLLQQDVLGCRGFVVF